MLQVDCLSVEWSCVGSEETETQTRQLSSAYFAFFSSLFDSVQRNYSHLRVLFETASLLKRSQSLFKHLTKLIAVIWFCFWFSRMGKKHVESAGSSDLIDNIDWKRILWFISVFSEYLLNFHSICFLHSVYYSLCLYFLQIPKSSTRDTRGYWTNKYSLEQILDTNIRVYDIEIEQRQSDLCVFMNMYAGSA